ncbi:hypothetical protein ACFQZE_08215 [Paenibacillus sp. GCM10027627]|uniref:hypothetical protein n=1 Tax=unclassified Paenibacillus TaxID=185978 RepID=UPI0036283475
MTIKNVLKIPLLLVLILLLVSCSNTQKSLDVKDILIDKGMDIQITDNRTNIEWLANNEWETQYFTISNNPGRLAVLHFKNEEHQKKSFLGLKKEHSEKIAQDFYAFYQANDYLIVYYSDTIIDQEPGISFVDGKINAAVQKYRAVFQKEKK